VIRIEIGYLKRVSSRTARPERSEYENRPLSCISLYTTFELSCSADIIQVDCCTVLLFSPILEARELPALRVREALIQTLFQG
jgi:hypothetical protein